MKFPSLSRTKPPAAPLNMENHTSVPVVTSSISRQNSKHENEKNVVETTPLDEAEALDKLSDEPEYPSGAKLGIIVASLGLSVFLMALVSPITYSNASLVGRIPISTRTTPSSPLQSQRSQIISKLSMMWVGMDQVGVPPFTLDSNTNPLLSLFTHYVCLPTFLREIIHFLQHQICLFNRDIHLRNRFSYLWCSTYFCCFDYWSRNFGRWSCRDIFRCSCHHSVRCSPRQEANIYRIGGRHVWNCKYIFRNFYPRP